MNVQLKADTTGYFTITSEDPELKKCEGYWYSTFETEDDNCVLHYRQNNHTGEISTWTFGINGVMKDSIEFDIPFRKNK